MTFMSSLGDRKIFSYSSLLFVAARHTSLVFVTPRAFGCSGKELTDSSEHACVKSRDFYIGRPLI